MKELVTLVAPSTFAVRFYRLLLWLYPPHFRKDYGSAMTLLFRDCLRDARNAGGQEVLRLWLSTLFDTVVSAPRAHIEEWSAMQASYTRSSQFGAICAFIAAILWTYIFGVGDLYLAVGNTMATLLILAAVIVTMVTLSALFNRLNVTQRSPFTLAGGVSVVVALVFLVVGTGMALMGSDSWYALMGTLAFLALGFGLMGVSASTQSSLGPLRFAPLLVIGVPIIIGTIFFFYSVTDSDAGHTVSNIVLGVALLGILGTGALLWTKAG